MRNGKRNDINVSELLAVNDNRLVNLILEKVSNNVLVKN